MPAHSFIITSSLLVLAALSSCLMGLVVLMRNPERITHRVFALLTFNLSMWSMGVFLIVHSQSEETARLWIMVTFAVASFLPATFYHFIGYFPDQRFRGMAWYLYLLYGMAFGLTALVNTRWYIKSLTFVPGDVPKATYGIVFEVYGVMLVATMVLMFANLFRSSGNPRAYSGGKSNTSWRPYSRAWASPRPRTSSRPRSSISTTRSSTARASWC